MLKNEVMKQTKYICAYLVCLSWKIEKSLQQLLLTLKENGEGRFQPSKLCMTSVHVITCD